MSKYINKDINDELDSISGGNLRFGLNQDVTIVSIEYGVTANAENINIKFDKDGTTTFGSVYKEKSEDKAQNTLATVKHIMKAFGTTEEVDAVLGEEIDSFKSLAEKAISFIQPRIATQNVDVFLEYDQLKEGKTSAYLKMPGVRFNGKFLCPATKNNFTEQRSWSDDTGKSVKGLRYVDGDIVHPFVRYEKYLESDNAKQKRAGDNSLQTPANGAEPVKKSSW